MFKNRWTVIPHALKQGAIPGVLVLLLLILLTGGSPVFASTHTTVAHKSHIVVLTYLRIRSGPTHIYHRTARVHPNGGPRVQCLSEGAVAYSPADNEVNGIGDTENLCLATTSGTQAMYIFDICAGIGRDGYTQWPFSLAVDFQFSATAYIDAGCVVCEDGVPIAYPPFTIKIDVYGDGSFTYRGRPFAATSNTAEASTVVANDGAFAPPC